MANRVQLEKEIRQYCELNNINDVSGFITQCMLKGFNIFKYGLSPGDNVKRQNGDIIDNGSNKSNEKRVKTVRKYNNSLKKEDKTSETPVNEKEKVDNTVQIQKSIDSNTETNRIEPIIMKKKRKITIIKNNE